MSSITVCLFLQVKNKDPDACPFVEVEIAVKDIKLSYMGFPNDDEKLLVEIKLKKT